MNQPQRLCLFGIVWLALGAALPAKAQPPKEVARSPRNGMTWGDLALLPPYCTDAQGIVYDRYTNESPRAAYWVSVMGLTFWHIHHYCNGLLLTKRAELEATSATQKKFLAQRAIKEYQYVIKNAEPGFTLLPEVLVREGEAYVKLGQYGAAYDAFDRARKERPDYWPAYSKWVDVLIGANDRRRALAMAEEGLKFAPDSQVLRNQFKSLGGDVSKLSTTTRARSDAPSAIFSPAASDTAASAAR